jgi:hypothetical protein
MTYTARQVEEAVENGEDGWMSIDWMSEGRTFSLDINGETVEATYVGGKQSEEGGGEHVYLVVKVGSQFFRKNGYYASHYGVEWDGSIEEVHPVEKTVTVYETH